MTVVNGEKIHTHTHSAVHLSQFRWVFSSTAVFIFEWGELTNQRKQKGGGEKIEIVFWSTSEITSLIYIYHKTCKQSNSVWNRFAGTVPTHKHYTQSHPTHQFVMKIWCIWHIERCELNDAGLVVGARLTAPETKIMKRNNSLTAI